MLSATILGLPECSGLQLTDFSDPLRPSHGWEFLNRFNTKPWLLSGAVCIISEAVIPITVMSYRTKVLEIPSQIPYFIYFLLLPHTFR